MPVTQAFDSNGYYRGYIPASLGATVVHVIFIQGWNKVYRSVATWLTDRENHRTEEVCMDSIRYTSGSPAVETRVSRHVLLHRMRIARGRGSRPQPGMENLKRFLGRFLRRWRSIYSGERDGPLSRGNSSITNKQQHT